jgi:glycosyltransferase involved in cell wall biosynthesis
MLSPLTSIIITTKNSEKYISETLNSVIYQTYQNKEIIILDAASTDNTMSVIDELIKNDQSKNIYKIHSEIDSGFHEGYCKALKMVTGKYVFTCPASDAFLDSNWIGNCITYLEMNPDFSLVWGYVVNKYGESLKNVSYPWLQKIGAPVGMKGFYYWLIFGTNFPEANMCTRTNVMKSTFPMYFEDKNIRMDPWLEMINNFHEGGFLAGHINSVANFGRIHEDSLTQENIKDKRNNIIEFRYHWKRLRLLVRILMKRKKLHNNDLDLKYNIKDIISIYYLYGKEIKNFYGFKSLFLPFAAIFYSIKVLEDIIVRERV